MINQYRIDYNVMETPSDIIAYGINAYEAYENLQVVHQEMYLPEDLVLVGDLEDKIIKHQRVVDDN